MKLLILSLVILGVLAEKLYAQRDEENEPDASITARLVEKLMKQSNGIARMVVPIENTNGSVQIDMGIALIDVINMNEENGQLTGMFWNRYKWSDYRLKWDPKDFGGKTSVRLPSSWVWKPDLKLYNSLEVGRTEDQDIMIVVYSTGDVLWVPPVIYNVFCNKTNVFNVDWKCKLKFGSWTYDGNTIDLAFYDGLEKLDLADYSERKWKIEGNIGRRDVKYYPCCEEPYLDMTYKFGLKHI